MPLILIAIAHILLQTQIPHITRDIAAIANIHPISGALSSTGILLWWASATMWLLTAQVLRNHHKNTETGFYLHSGILSAYLALDDFFLFHEVIAPMHLHIPEKAVFVLLGLVMACYMTSNRRLLKSAEGAPLVLAICFLTGSALADTVFERLLAPLKDWSFLIEDGLKWLGICFWTVFAGLKCSQALSQIGCADPTHAKR